MVFRLLRPDAVSVWKDPEILKRFKRYRGIIDGTEIARYVVAKSLPCTIDKDSPLESLEAMVHQKSQEFRELLKLDVSALEKSEIPETSYLDLLELVSRKYLEKCNFCERVCGANRTIGEKGYCLIDERSFVSSAFLHTGEESVLIPSGTIFFQGCNFGCVFCQNHDISQAWKGKRELEDICQQTDKYKLAALADRLVDNGAININYVGGDPIPNIHTIIGNLIHQSHNICQLWNSNFYLTEKSLSLILDIMDFWLPDFKYGCNECGEKYSGVKNYFDVVSRNHKIIHDEGSGEIIIRHLVMPNHVDCCSKPILDFVAKEIPKAVVNIMGQYHPEYHSHKYPEINRRPTSEEMIQVKNHADNLGILYKPVS